MIAKTYPSAPRNSCLPIVKDRRLCALPPASLLFRREGQHAGLLGFCLLCANGRGSVQAQVTGSLLPHLDFRNRAKGDEIRSKD